MGGTKTWCGLLRWSSPVAAVCIRRPEERAGRARRGAEGKTMVVFPSSFLGWKRSRIEIVRYKERLGWQNWCPNLKANLDRGEKSIVRCTLAYAFSISIQQQISSSLSPSRCFLGLFERASKQAMDTLYVILSLAMQNYTLSKTSKMLADLSW